jgi:tetratricopeptide (TPR) repeat protein
MVLRILVLIILCSSTTVLARSSGRSMQLQLAQKFYKQKKYVKSIISLKKSFNLKRTKNTPTPVIQLLALNYLKLKKYKVASRFFHIVIRRNYKEKHAEVLRSLSSGGLSDVEVPQKLLRIYYHLGQIYYKIFFKTKSIPYYRASEKYFKICEEKGHLDDNSAEYIDSLAAVKSLIDKKEFTGKWFATIGTLNWQEKLELIDSTNGNKTKLLSNAKALCIGGGYRYTNAYHGVEISSCFYSGSAKISADNAATYSQDGVAVSGFLVDSGYVFKPYSEKVALIFSIPLFYRDGEYAQPDNFSIPGKGQLSAGLFVKARYELPIIDLIFSIGNMGSTNVLMLQTGYTF